MAKPALKFSEIKELPTHIPYQVCQFCDNVYWHYKQPFDEKGCGCQHDPANGPQPGDAVILVGEHSYLEKYNRAIGIVEGRPQYVPGKIHVCLNEPSVYRTADFVSISGGPWILPHEDLFTHIGAKDVRFWKWGRHGRGAGLGEYYSLSMQLWNLDIGRL